QSSRPPQRLRASAGGAGSAGSGEATALGAARPYAKGVAALPGRQPPRSERIVTTCRPAVSGIVPRSLKTPGQFSSPRADPTSRPSTEIDATPYQSPPSQAV